MAHNKRERERLPALSSPFRNLSLLAFLSKPTRNKPNCYWRRVPLTDQSHLPASPYLSPRLSRIMAARLPTVTRSSATLRSLCCPGRISSGVSRREPGPFKAGGRSNGLNFSGPNGTVLVAITTTILTGVRPLGDGDV